MDYIKSKDLNTHVYKIVLESHVITFTPQCIIMIGLGYIVIILHVADCLQKKLRVYIDLVQVF